MEEDDINWCTGFWNELVRENPPSLYPDSPIFSSKECDWNDPSFLENVFVCPDVEEVFFGTHLSEDPAFTEDSFETRRNDDMYSVYPSSTKPFDIENIVTQAGSSTNVSKQKTKRPRKPKVEKAETPSKRKCTASSTTTPRKTKAKK